MTKDPFSDTHSTILVDLERRRVVDGTYLTPRASRQARTPDGARLERSSILESAQTVNAGSSHWPSFGYPLPAKSIASRSAQ